MKPTKKLHWLLCNVSLADSACTRSDSAPGETTDSRVTYHFQPSMNNHENLVTCAHFWFYAGEGAAANSSAQLFILTAAQQLLQAAEAPSTVSSDGWTTYELDRSLLASVAEGPFQLQVHCLVCQCHTNETDKMPFLHLLAQPRGHVRSPRHAPLTIPWSPSALDLFQRPSQERPQYGDCQRAEVEISFQELGWDNWIVHPKVLAFYYCHGNCSAPGRTSFTLGITQCCAPVPGTMRSMQITTTSDGGYSFKHETLPNIIPEECACIWTLQLKKQVYPNCKDSLTASVQAFLVYSLGLTESFQISALKWNYFLSEKCFPPKLSMVKCVENNEEQKQYFWKNMQIFKSCLRALTSINRKTWRT